MQYEWNLLPGLAESQESDKGQAYRRSDCSLFGKKLLAALKHHHSGLTCLLEAKTTWANELAELRDPAAHRVPIYVPPSVVTSTEQEEEFRRIMNQTNLPLSELGAKSISEIIYDAQVITDFMPIMILSSERGLELRPIISQLTSDHGEYLATATAVVDELGIQKLQS